MVDEEEVIWSLELVFLLSLSFIVWHNNDSQYVQHASHDSNLLGQYLHGTLEHPCTASFAGQMLGCDS